MKDVALKWEWTKARGERQNGKKIHTIVLKANQQQLINSFIIRIGINQDTGRDKMVIDRYHCVEGKSLLWIHLWYWLT
jgi:hypothetical protein